MKIVVLGGSPKGDNSVTLQYVAFIQKKFPQHEFEVFNIAQRIRQIETDREVFDGILQAVKTADAVLWAFPLYVLLAHGNYKRFIELIGERSAEAAFAGKYTAVLTTSIHFYDHTAHNYLHGICDDWNMRFLGSYSAGMQDLFKEKEQEKLAQFAKNFFDAIDRAAPTERVFAPLTTQTPEFIPVAAASPIGAEGKKVVIVTDARRQDVNLARMTERFVAALGGEAEVVNLHDIDIKGGCLGCIRCGYDNRCAYADKDGFVDFFNAKIKTADVLVFAGAIRDRYLSSLWKTYFDRAFFNTHIPSLRGKQIVWLISGALTQLPNLREIFEAYTQVQRANLVGILSDENPDSARIGSLIHEAARQSIACAKAQYIQPQTFLGVGAAKIFRDEIWGPIRFPFAADHQYYSKNGFYDFPQRDYLTRARNFMLGWIVKVPAIRQKVYGATMVNSMVESYKKVLAKI